VRRSWWAAFCVLPLWAQTAPELAKQGEQIFNRTCATGYCHALRGGTGGGAPRLAARGFDEAYIGTVTARGLPGTAMPAFGAALPRAELTAVVAYLATLNGIASPNLNFGFGGRGGGPLEPALPPEAARGRALFHDPVRGFGRCATCHEVNGMGIPVATPITKLPADVPSLRALATPQVSTATVDGESMPALVVGKRSGAIVFYDLTVPPPVLRTVEGSAVKIAAGSGWRHASAASSYSDAELELVLAYLRTVAQP
jgi:mono/diheme cytochrome c family protein